MLDAQLDQDSVGFISNSVENATMTLSNNWFYSTSLTEIGLKTGLLFAIPFPVIMFFSVIVLRKNNVQNSDYNTIENKSSK